MKKTAPVKRQRKKGKPKNWAIEKKSATKNERVGKQGNTKLLSEITKTEKTTAACERLVNGCSGRPHDHRRVESSRALDVSSRRPSVRSQIKERLTWRKKQTTCQEASNVSTQQVGANTMFKML